MGPPVDGAALVDQHGVAGAWQFADAEGDRTVTVAFVDGDLWQAAAAIGPTCAGTAARRPNGRARWSVSMPFAGTGSLR